MHQICAFTEVYFSALDTSPLFILINSSYLYLLAMLRRVVKSCWGLDIMVTWSEPSISFTSSGGFFSIINSENSFVRALFSAATMNTRLTDPYLLLERTISLETSSARYK
uniref:Methylketone synthase I n=1 Tax=Solanum tuberosum TaxID=4113 RepID=M1CG10_SOLTU